MIHRAELRLGVAAVSDDLLHELVLAQAAQTPQAIALIDGDTNLSYRDLDTRANRIARLLRTYGIGPEARVGVCLDRSLDLAAGWLAVLKAGAAYVPLDPAYPPERLNFIMQDAQISAVLTIEPLAGLVEALPDVPILLLDGAFGAALARTSAAALPKLAHPDNLAYVIYTSGSTGQPKGVAVQHRAVANLVRWHLQAFEVTQHDRATAVAGLGFDAAVWEIWPYLCAGASVHLVDEQIRASAELLRDWLIDQRITIAFLPTPIAERALQLDWPADGALRLLLTGGDTLHRYPPASAPFTLVNNYGPTECAVVSTSGMIAPQPGDQTDAPVIGWPIAHVRAYVLDAALQPVQPGEAGELYLGGAGVARGYLFRPDLTAEVFLPDPWSDPEDARPGARMYRTGDRVRRCADGSLQFLGRIDDQIKLRGYRIELGEIEAVLRRHPAVQNAVVAMRHDARGEKRLVAYVVTEEPRTKNQEPDSSAVGSQLSVLHAHELRAFLQDRLPAYMIPTAFVGLDVLPLTANGKVDRRALPQPQIQDDEQRRAAPQTAVEQTLAAIWRDVLGQTFVGRYDNFFELGGDSIVSIQIVAQARQSGFQLSSKDIFDAPTIAELAERVTTVALVEAEQGSVTGDMPLTPIQRWFFAQELPAPHHFNQTFLVEVREPLDLALLERALAALITHHDALRLRYRREADGWRQWHDETNPQRLLDVVDLAAAPFDTQTDTAFESLVAERQASLDLLHGPLVRGTVFTRADSSTHLLLVVHHLVVDGVSWRILLEDLERAYRQLQRKQQVQLPAKTTSFQRWATRLVEHARTDQELHRQADYWRALAQRSVAPLPVDVHGQTNDGARVQTVWTALSVKETTALLHDVPRSYRTQINDVLLTALALTFERWTGAQTLLVNLEGHGREPLFADLDISRTVGWFTSIFPVLLDLEQTTDLGTALVAIKEQLRRLPRRGIGYGILRFLSGDAVDLPPLPTPQISFNYLGQFDRSFGGASSLFRLIRESHPSDRSPHNPRPHLLEVDGYIDQGHLRFAWTYSDNVYHAATVARLAEEFNRQLSTLIRHCSATDAGRLTPSDVPLARLDQPQLDRLIQRLQQRPSEHVGSAAIEDVYPLSPLQEGMLVHKLRVADDEIYSVQYSCVLSGQVDRAALERAWQLVSAQHPILRTAFVWESLTQPLQIVQREVELPWQIEDWRALDPSAQQERLDRFLRADRVRGFALDRAPLMRLALFHLSEERYRLVWSFHHLLLDGWSTPLVLRQVFDTAAQLARGSTPQLDRARPFRDYIAWLQSRPQADAEHFWRAELRGISEPTALGLDRPFATSAATPGLLTEVRCQVSENVTATLSGIARRHKLTLNTLVQGIWALLLSRYSGAADVLFGTTVATRPAELDGVERMIGPLINTLPVRVQVQPSAPLLPWLAELQARQSEARKHDTVGLAGVQRWSEIPATAPLFESLLVFEHYPASGPDQDTGDGLLVREPLIFERTSYPLTIVVGAGSTLTLKLIYDPARFDGSAVERIAAHLSLLLEGLAAAPESRVAELPWLSRADMEQISAWNATAEHYPQADTLPALIAAQAARTPEAVALRFEATTLSYRALDQRANQVAQRLHSQGIGRESLVGLCFHRSIELVVAMLGILKAGAAYVPLDPDYPAERLQFMLEDAQVAAVLTTEALVERVSPSAQIAVLTLDGSFGASLAQAPTLPPTITIDPEQLAYVIYTSGSTGRPKGVMNTHAGVVNRLLWGQATYPIDARDRVLQKTPVSFDVSVWEFFWPLIAGATLVLARPGGHKDPAYLRETIIEAEITIIHFVPPMLGSFLEQPDIERCTSLQRVFCSGEALPFDLQQRCFARLPVTIHNLYGPTEASIEVTHWTCRRESDRALVPIGHPIANLRTYILDAQLQPVPIGVAGELYLGGLGVARGYHRRAALTAEKFLPDPFARPEGTRPGARMYRTGDRARYLADGAIDFMGRLDDQVKLRGFRIELGEISAQLRAQPGVAEAVTLLRSGAGDTPQLAAYVTAQTGAELVPADLRAALKAHLPEFMIPTTVSVLPTLPLLPNGKLDRRALPSPGVPADLSTTYVAPRNEIEQRLTAIWATVLKQEQIGVHDNFFERGGHSLLAMQLLGRIHEEMGSQLQLRTIFENPSIAALAEQIAQMGRRSDGVTLARVGRDAYRVKRSALSKDQRNRAE